MQDLREAGMHPGLRDRWRRTFPIRPGWKRISPIAPGPTLIQHWSCRHVHNDYGDVAYDDRVRPGEVC